MGRIPNLVMKRQYTGSKEQTVQCGQGGCTMGRKRPYVRSGDLGWIEERPRSDVVRLKEVRRELPEAHGKQACMMIMGGEDSEQREEWALVRPEREVYRIAR